MKLGMRGVLWLGAGVLAALLLTMPMRIALVISGLDARGLSARSVAGTVWSADLADARFGDVDLGSLHLGVAPLHLLAGQLRLGVRGVDTPGVEPINGAIVSGIGGEGIESMRGVVPVGQVFAPLPISAVALDAVSVRFVQGQCRQASGQAEMRLSGGIDGAPGVTLPRALRGDIHCQAGALLLPLTSQSGTEALTLRVHADGRFRAELSLQPGDAGAAAQLQRAGFIAGPRGYRFSVEGRF